MLASRVGATPARCDTVVRRLKPDSDTDLTSPELVLVSGADAAERARQGLAEPPPASPDPPAPTSAVQTRRADPPPYPRVTLDTPAPRRKRRRRRRWPLVLLIAVVLVGAVVFFVVRNHDTSSGVAEKSAGSQGNTSARPSAFVPARTWVWGMSEGARAYVFALSRDGRVVLSARTRQARYELPRSFRFRPGKYRWTVRRIPETSGRPLSDSTFVLSAATAARANR